jgi:uncharacterized protein YjiS (DUF1127 family)
MPVTASGRRDPYRRDHERPEGPMTLARNLYRWIDIVFFEWPERGRSRRCLARMTDRELADIGVNRCDIGSIVESRYARCIRDGI